MCGVGARRASLGLRLGASSDTACSSRAVALAPSLIHMPVLYYPAEILSIADLLLTYKYSLDVLHLITYNLSLGGQVL